MSSSFSHRPLVTASLFSLLLFAPACITPESRHPDLSVHGHDGHPQTLAAVDREIAAAGRDAARLAAVAHGLTATLRDPSATFAARQAAAQRLGLFPAAILLVQTNAALFADMLADEQQVELARLALEQVPGSAIDALFFEALNNLSGKTRLALIQSLGNRRVAAAVAPLAVILREGEPALAAAATKALGQIGTADALATLRGARNTADPAVVEATLTAAHAVGGPEALRSFQQISDHANAPAHLRAAALRSLLFLEPADAPDRITTALAGDDATLKAAVLEALASHPSSELVPLLGTHLAAWDAVTQCAVIGALARRGDARAVPPIAAAVAHTEPAVRHAAIAALGDLPGDAAIARLLASIADSAETIDARLARQSLARLRGNGVVDTVLAGASTAASPHRLVFIEQLAARYMTDAVPSLLAMRPDPDAAVRTAALASLGEIAPASTQRVILEWTVAATDPTEQARALRALAEITLRQPDVVERIAPIAQALEHADAALALRLLPVLPRVGGAASAQAAASLALREDHTVANAAMNTLSRWSDQTGLHPLIDVAEKARDASRRIAAVQGSIRFLERARELSSAELVTAISRLLAVSSDEPARRQLVFLLGRGKDDRALSLAQKLKSEPALADEAADAALAVAANLAGPPTARTSSGEANIHRIFDGNTRSSWAASADAGRWIEVDFKRTRPLRQAILDQSAQPGNLPEHLEFFVTDDLASPGKPRASVAGSPNRTTVDFPANTHGRYLIIRHTADRANGWWTISELYVD